MSNFTLVFMKILLLSNFDHLLSKRYVWANNRRKAKNLARKEERFYTLLCEILLMNDFVKRLIIAYVWPANMYIKN